jgi:general secretion pathway protein G
LVIGELMIEAILRTLGARPRVARRVPGTYRQITKTDSQILESSNSQLGFTLIELLVVSAILVVLAGIGLVQYKNGKTRASEAVLKTDLFNMRDAIDQYYADKGQYPGTLDELVSAGYLRKVPEDPFTGNNGTWQTIQSEPDASNPTAGPGVYDVKSGSDATALDGSRYADW